MKRIYSLLLALSLMLGMLSCTAYASDTATVYAPDGRSKVIATSEVEAYCGVGWYTEPVTYLYTADGRTGVFLVSEVAAQLTVGWYEEPFVTLYTLDGRTGTFAASQVAAQLTVGWYEEPMVTLYTADGRTGLFGESQVAAQLTVGWYEEPVTTLYTADGRTGVFAQSQVDAQLSVGWYTEPMTTLYAADGRTGTFAASSVDAQLAVGWYTSERAALSSAYPQQSVSVLSITPDLNFLDGAEVDIIWRNNSGKQIKYITFTCLPYNAVGDVVASSIGNKTTANLKVTGPVDTFQNSVITDYAGTSNSYNIGLNIYFYWDDTESKVTIHRDTGMPYVYTDGYGFYYLTTSDYDDVFDQSTHWDAIWYNSTITTIDITQIAIEYMDGTTETIYNPPIWNEIW